MKVGSRSEPEGGSVRPDLAFFWFDIWFVKQWLKCHLGVPGEVPRSEAVWGPICEG